MRVIGTAGHVDHGKSTLVQALTGTHPDRLKEEQAREMTIELGFAFMNLPAGETVGIVDVPGHRDFIENMLAGVGGIDAVLFVVAADEGVMPQTREHLSILDILQIQGGVIALTKTDMIDDPDWLDLVELDVHEAVRGTVLADAPIVRVSARSGAGIAGLIAALETCLAERPPRPDLGRPRLPVDRVFTIPGFGTVVTGTLLDGAFQVGDEVEILPDGIKGRIRGLQSHKLKTATALAGSRTAVNISGVNVDDIRRGEVVAHPGKYKPVRRMDVRFKLLADVETPLKHNTTVKFFIGASEVLARVRTLGCEELLPGQEGWLQLELETAVVAVRGDRYILRRPSPSETLGGGSVLDPQPGQRHRRFSASVIKRLESLQNGAPEDVLFQAAVALGIAPVKEVVARARLSAEQAANALNDLIAQGMLIALEAGSPSISGDMLVISLSGWNTLTQKAVKELEQYHQAYPLRMGMPREEFKSRLKVTPKIFNLVMKRWGSEKILVEGAAWIALPDHQVVFSPAQRKMADQLLAQFAAAPYSPPSVKDAEGVVGEELFNALIQNGTLFMVSQEVVFRKQEIDQMLAAVQMHFESNPGLTLAEFRDRFNTTRKYAQAFLEYLDSTGVTLREGDIRKLRAGRK